MDVIANVRIFKEAPKQSTYGQCSRKCRRVVHMLGGIIRGEVAVGYQDTTFQARYLSPVPQY